MGAAEYTLPGNIQEGSMLKNIIVFIVGAMLLAGCGKFKEQEAAEQAAAAKAKAVAEAAAKKAAGPTDEEKNQAAKALITLVCSSPNVLEEAETSIDLYEAFSGDGADKIVARNHFMKSKNYYSALLENELPARGSSYKTLALYAKKVIPRQSASEANLKEFRELVRANCQGVDAEQGEKVVSGILLYCAAPIP